MKKKTNIRKWLEKKAVQQLLRGLRQLKEIRIQLDPESVREYFKGLFGRERMGPLFLKEVKLLGS
jgi:hypothetical protein